MKCLKVTYDLNKFNSDSGPCEGSKISEIQIFSFLASWVFDPFMTHVFSMKKLGSGGVRPFNFAPPLANN
jgi:hypothetical protein